MLNQIVMVGRITRNVELKELEGGKKVADICLAIQRSYKNAEGVYETDFIPVELSGAIAESTSEYCKKGDIVGVKGRIASETEEGQDGNITQRIKVVAEKVTFLSSKRNDDIEE